MSIDIRTAAIFMGLTQILQVIALFAQYRINKVHEGPGWWALGNAAYALGYILYYLRTDPILAPVAIVGNFAMFVLGSIALYIGVLRFFGRRECLMRIMAFWAVFSVVGLYFTYIHDDLAVRQANISVALALFAFLVAHALIAHKTPAVSASASFLAVIFLVCGILLTVRAFVSLAVPPSEIFSPTPTQTATLLITLFASTLWTLGFIILVNQRLITENREAKEHFELIFNTSPDAAIISRMDDGTIVDANGGLLAISGYSRAELHGRSSVDLDLWENRADRRKFVLELRENGYCENYEAVFRARDGSHLVGIVSAKILGLQGTRHILSVIRNITERKRAEEEQRKLELRLRRAEKMEALGTMAGGVAHDLNNVLGIIVGYSEMLFRELPASSPAKTVVVKILKSGQRAAAIVHDLLTLARRGIPNRKVLNLNGIVRDCQDTPEFSKLASSQDNVLIETHLEADLLNISGSSVHLAKLLMNLASNAFEAMPGGGILTIRTANCYLDRLISGYDEVREGDYVLLSVSDTGEGISASSLRHIFEPFYTRKVMGRSGTGLGLAVVWGAVKDHQGYIDVESEEGKGTTFTLYFPVTRERITPEQVAVSASEYMGDGRSILVVDDVKEQRELATMMLAKLNYRVHAVSSGEEAVEYLRNNSADLIVLDMIMDPGIDGLDTYAKILEFRPRQKAIIVSGFSETERVIRAQELGAGSYVRKPYVLEKLGLAVKKEFRAESMAFAAEKDVHGNGGTVGIVSE